jgi:hypothetical protein
VESIPQPTVQGGDAVATASSPVAPAVKLPEEPVHMFLREGTDSRFEAFFIDARYGWSVEDYQFYKVWCLEKGRPFHKNTLHKVRLYDYSSPDLPPRLRNMDFNRINYIINHKPEGASKKAIQEAIWYYTKGEGLDQMSPEAVKIIDEAREKGKDYVPGDGELVAVVSMPTDDIKQATIIEIPVPPAVAAPPITAVPPAPVMAAASSFPYAAGALAPLIATPFLFSGGGGGSGGGENEQHSIYEPSTLALLLTVALCCLLAARSRRNRKIGE